MRPVDGAGSAEPGLILARMRTGLEVVAAGQGGPFTRTQALAAGWTEAQVRTSLRTGRWQVLARGVYVTAEVLAATQDDAAAEHVLHAAARVLSHEGAVASHRTGALVHGLPLLGHPPTRPQLTRDVRSPADRSATSSLYAARLTPQEVTSRRGIPVTSLARTACDVARRGSFRAGVVTADAALRAGLRGVELVAAAHTCRSWPGGPRAVRVAGFADGRAESPLESITRVAYALEDLPAPETQVEIRAPDGRFLGLVDFLWRAQRTVGEADGLLKYDEDPLALRKEKVREDGLRAYGFETVRNTWDDVWLPHGRRELARRAQQAFGWAAIRPPVEGVRFRTPPLAELLRRRPP